MSGTAAATFAVVAAALLGMAFAAPSRAGAAPAPLYARSGAPAGGDGSIAKPFNSLNALQRASRRRQRLVILPAGLKRGPLDGGIKLKPGQKLIGKRPRKSRRKRAAPVLANTTDAHHGDAITLANRVSVIGIHVNGARRGGIYGRNVRGVRIRRNDVTAFNTTCTNGLLIQPFILPTLVPGVGVPISGGLSNAWAAIMVDANRGTGRIRIARNRVHDNECGDGIDIRLSGKARRRARVTRNLVVGIQEGSSQASVLAIGMQTLDKSSLRVLINRNRERRIGSINLGQDGADPDDDTGQGVPGAGADSEGVFADSDDTSKLRAVVSRNRFREGIGGFSANGLEFVITGGSPDVRVRISRSTFRDVAGDVIETINFGIGARMRAILDHVVAEKSNGLGDTHVIPGNNGDCLVAGQNGPGDVTSLLMNHTKLVDCVNNGILLGSNVTQGSGQAAAAVTFDIRNSTIADNKGYGIRVGNLTALDRLRGRIERTRITNNKGNANVALDNIGGTGASTLDLGGGELGSSGRNCFFGGVLDAEGINATASLTHNWWGAPGAPGPTQTLAAGGSFALSPGLAAAPKGVC